MFLNILLASCGILILFLLYFLKQKLAENGVLKAKEEFYLQTASELEKARQEGRTYSNQISRLEAELEFLKPLKDERTSLVNELSKVKEELASRPTKQEKQSLELANANITRELIEIKERLSSQIKLEADLSAMLEKTKLEITNQNRQQYSSIAEQSREQYSKIAENLQKSTDEKNKETTKEVKDVFERIIEKDVKETMAKMQESLQIHKDTLLRHQKPIEAFTKIFAGSKESGSHGEQTIVNQLDNMGLRYGQDYFTQIGGRGGEEERLIADVVILIPNSGKKDVLIVDSKSSTKLGSDASEFLASIDASLTVFAKKDYKTAVEKKLKELIPDIQINQTHLFVYLPFDRMLSRVSEEKPELLQKFREKDIGVLTPIILDFLLDTTKLYSAKLEFNNNVEQVMKDVKILIERTLKVLECVRDVGKSIEASTKKYDNLKKSVKSRFAPSVRKIAKDVDVKIVALDDFFDDFFDDLNEEDMKEIEIK
jgi:DNA anti-recombination protein RmuC